MSDLSGTAAGLLATLDARLIERDREGAVDAALDAVRSGAVTIPALHRVLRDLLILTGERWHAGDEEVWEEHFTSAAVRTIVENLYADVIAAAAGATPTGRVVLLACPPQEFHDLGPRMLADRFRMAGWTAHFLGADVPTDQIAEAALAFGADLVVLNATTHLSRLQTRDIFGGLKERLAGVDLRVFGQAFARDHAGWADEDLFDVPAWFGDE